MTEERSGQQKIRVFLHPEVHEGCILTPVARRDAHPRMHKKNVLLPVDLVDYCWLTLADGCPSLSPPAAVQPAELLFECDEVVLYKKVSYCITSKQKASTL